MGGGGGGVPMSYQVSRNVKAESYVVTGGRGQPGGANITLSEQIYQS